MEIAVNNILNKEITAAFDKWIDVNPEAAINRKSLDLFIKKGFPTNKDEVYKHTPVERLLRQNFNFGNLVFSESWSGVRFDDEFYPEEGNHLVFVNGINKAEFGKGNSLESGSIENNTLDVFLNLNSAFRKNTHEIKAERNSDTLNFFVYHFIDSTEGSLFLNPSLKIVAEESSSINIVERFIFRGENQVFINSSTDISVAANAKVNLTKTQDLPAHVFLIDTIIGGQSRDSILHTNTFSFSGKLIRNNLNIAINDENCEAHMNGLYLLTGNSHVDNSTSVDHRMPHSYSNEHYKGIVDENAVGVFNGRIYVRPDAQQTNAFQSNQNISLSETAKIHTKPQLEIWADDVKCSHGCTVGQLDDEAIFYLRTRGLDKRSAKAMILMAFAEETLTHVPVLSVKEEIAQKINGRLS